MKARALVITLPMVVLLAGGRLVLGQRRADLAVANGANAPGYSAATHAFLNRQDLGENMKATEDLASNGRVFEAAHELARRRN
jgi:hypothetical protein